METACKEKSCPCTYSCDKKGKCCLCLEYHRDNQELPACYFTPEEERTYNRSIKYYIKNNNRI